MQPSEIALIFDHLYWVRDRILDAAAPPGVTWPGTAPDGLLDLRATLVHELDVEWSWRRRLTSADPTEFPAEDVELVPDDFPSVASIRERWIGDEMEMRAWLGEPVGQGARRAVRARRRRAATRCGGTSSTSTRTGSSSSATPPGCSAPTATRRASLDFLGFVESRERDAA